MGPDAGRRRYKLSRVQHLLVDEFLSTSLVAIAHDEGYAADHVVRRGWAGVKDWQLLKLIEQNGLLFVTNDRSDWLRLLGGAACMTV